MVAVPALVAAEPVPVAAGGAAGWTHAFVSRVARRMVAPREFTQRKWIEAR